MAVLAGVYPREFPFFLFSELGPCWLGCWLATGGVLSGFASRFGGFRFSWTCVAGVTGLGEDESELESTTYRPRVRVHVMTIERTTTGINKAGDAGRMDAQIGSADALQRVFPTALSSYLPFRNSSELVR